MKFLIVMLLAGLQLWAAVGQIAALRGTLNIERDGNMITAKIGTSLEKQDTLKTGDNSKAQLLFNDDTSITMGKNSELKVEKYFFEGGNAASNAEFGMLKGFFKSVTGKMGKISPDKFKLKTKNATIGIRGTHILASIQDDIEKIACTQGAIYVEALGASVDVMAGEITEVLPDSSPTLPRALSGQEMNDLKGGLGIGSSILKKIQAVRLNEEGEADSEAMSEALSEIRSIKETDKRIKALDLLETQLNQQLDSILEGQYYKTDVPMSYDPMAPTASDSDPLDWGYYTQKAITVQNGQYMVDGQGYVKFDEALMAAGPVEMWLDEAAKSYTPEENIVHKMGQTVENLGVYSHWDGRLGSREVTEFEGKSIGIYQEAGEVTGVIAENENNQAYFLMDYGNRHLAGSLNFDTLSASGVTKPWELGFVSAGGTAITPTSFYTNDFYEGPSGSIFLATYLMYSRFFGEEADQVGGYYEMLANDAIWADYLNGTLTSFDDPKYEPYKENVLGLFVATNVETHQLEAKEAGSNEYFSWGYWAEKDLGDLSVASIVAANPYGAWVKPKDGLSETTAEEIEALKNSQLSASYQGDVWGSVHEAGGDAVQKVMENGQVNLDVNFGTLEMTGAMGFDAGGEHWGVDIHQGVIDGNSLMVQEISNAASSDVMISEYNMEGKFFGPNAEALGGGFEMISTDHQVAIGAFGAQR